MNKLSNLAENIIGSEVIKFANIIRKKIENGENILNLTIGDFDPKIYPIPNVLTELIQKYYDLHKTNYPPAAGEDKLIEAVLNFINENMNTDFNKNEIVITAGARPAIYTTYLTLLDNGDTVCYPIPSWNNNHYTYLSNCKHLGIETNEKNNYLLVASDIKEQIQDITLLSLCSPQNPTGTSYTYEQLKDICDLVLEENKRREELNKKPLYVMYDQIYWMLNYNNKHVNPIDINYDMKKYTIFIDGASKYLCATGIRVGWCIAPDHVISKMRSLLSHIGAWSPKAEQLAVADYLITSDIYIYNENVKEKILNSLNKIYNDIQELKSEGYDIDCIKPNSGIYLTVKINVPNVKDADEAFNIILDKAKIGLVPMYAFGMDNKELIFRISVGTVDGTILEGFKERLKKIYE